MVIYITIIVVIIFIWHVIGAGVLGFIDHDERLIKWYENCPKEISWWAQPLIITCRPILIYFYYRRK